MKNIRNYMLLACIFMSSMVMAENGISCFLQAEFGGSFAMKPDFCVVTSTGNWDTAPEGYNGSLGAAPLVGAVFGFAPECHPWLSVGFSAALRSNFMFCKHQTFIAGNVQGAAKTRYLNVDNSSYMANIYFNKAHKSSRISYEFCNVSWMPFLGFGIGLARNSLFNFYSVSDTENAVLSGIPRKGVNSIMTPIVFNQCAVQVQIGIDTVIIDAIEVGLSYRFFYAGKLSTNNYTMVLPGANPGPAVFTTSPPWRGTLKANELVVNIGVLF